MDLAERIGKLETTITGNGGQGHEQRIEQNKIEIEKKVDILDCQKQHQDLINVIKGKKEGARWWAQCFLYLAPWVVIVLTLLKII